jgi:luciferase family oxidoreductase group 1
MSHSFRLGTLDLCHLRPSLGPAEVLRSTLGLAPVAESLGYSRYWVAEHHNPYAAHSAPEILLPALAERTKTIRVGTAGILLTLYSPYKVATAFRLLSALYPGRIDLGVGRHPSSEVVRKLMLGEGPQAPYADKVAELVSFLRGEGEAQVPPVTASPPEIWILGAQTTSMELAAENGRALCLSIFLESEAGVDLRPIVAAYQERFRPSPELAEPKWAIAFSGVCAETEHEARRMAAERLPIIRPSVVGTPEQCREGIEEIRERYGTAELIFLDLAHTLEERARSHGLLAEALELRGPGAPAPASREPALSPVA